MEIRPKTSDSMFNKRSLLSASSSIREPLYGWRMTHDAKSSSWHRFISFYRNKNETGIRFFLLNFFFSYWIQSCELLSLPQWNVKPFDRKPCVVVVVVDVVDKNSLCSDFGATQHKEIKLNSKSELIEW